MLWTPRQESKIINSEYAIGIERNFRIYETVRIFKDSLSHISPCFMEKWAALLSVENKFPSAFKKELVPQHFSTHDGTWTGIVNFYESWLDGFFAGSPIGISTDLTRITPELRCALKEKISAFKVEEPFWRNASARIIADTDRLLALQYETDDMIKVVVYTGKPVVQTHMTVYPVLDGREFVFDGKIYDGNGLVIENPIERNSYIFTLERK